MRERSPCAIGRSAEEAVADYLFARGAAVLERNVRFGHDEIDIVAREARTACVVEVRTRGKGAWARGLESITWRKRKLLLRAARKLWRERLRRMPGVDRVRIDVASVTFSEGRTTVEYVEGAVGAF